MEPVFFYGHRNGPHRSFSNFYACTFTCGGKTWNCSEQAYMYYKSTDEEYREKLLALSDPYAIKRLGQTCELIPGWDEKKYDVMYAVVLAKFSQNPDLAAILLSTGSASIHENCKDRWWGGGPNFPQGRDWLGKILQKVRAKLGGPEVEPEEPEEEPFWLDQAETGDYCPDCDEPHAPRTIECPRWLKTRIAVRKMLDEEIEG